MMDKARRQVRATRPYGMYPGSANKRLLEIYTTTCAFMKHGLNAVKAELTNRGFKKEEIDNGLERLMECKRLSDESYVERDKEAAKIAMRMTQFEINRLNRLVDGLKAKYGDRSHESN